jgi:hypothetical protein
LSLLEAEPGVSSEEVQAESEREPIVPSSEQQSSETSDSGAESKRKRSGRQSLPAHLPRVEKIVSCPREQCTCSKCGEATAVIGYEESEVLDVKPAEYFVTVVSMRPTNHTLPELANRVMDSMHERDDCAEASPEPRRSGPACIGVRAKRSDEEAVLYSARDLEGDA